MNPELKHVKLHRDLKRLELEAFRLRKELKQHQYKKYPTQNLQLGAKSMHVNAVIEPKAYATLNTSLPAENELVQLAIDSGATIHAIRSKKHIQDFKPFSNPYPVKVAGGETHSATGTGTLTKTVYTTGGARTIKIPEVLVISDLHD